jgi:hypothetical protein
MLDPAVTRVGIAVAQATGKRYRVYWSLVLAAPATRRHCERSEAIQKPQARRSLPLDCFVGSAASR